MLWVLETKFCRTTNLLMLCISPSFMDVQISEEKVEVLILPNLNDLREHLRGYCLSLKQLIILQRLLSMRKAPPVLFRGMYSEGRWYQRATSVMIQMDLVRLSGQVMVPSASLLDSLRLDESKYWNPCSKLEVRRDGYK